MNSRAHPSSPRATLLGAACALLAAAGCNVPEPAPGTGGVTTGGDACGRGLVVVSTDYQSANVSLLGLDGAVLSSSFISSATTSPTLSAPLSGDIGVPTTRQATDRIVILDRFLVSVLTWVDVKTAAPSAQLSTATGFSSNPLDYVEVSPTKAYVSRYEPNKKAGMEPFDQGNDILILDPSVPAITGRIDLLEAMAGEDPANFPRANRMVMAERKLYVLLSGYSFDFKTSAPSRIVTIDVDTDAIVEVKVLEGMHGCGALSISPSEKLLAVACTGTYATTAGSVIEESGVVVLSRGASVEEVSRRYAKDFGTSPLGLSIAFATEANLVFTTLGSFGVDGQESTDDALVALNIETGKFDVALQSKELPFSLGEVQCAPGCSVCFVADAETQGGVVQRFEVGDDGRLMNPLAIVVDSEIGLPPRYLGRF